MAQRLGDRIRRALRRVLSPRSADGSRPAPAPRARRPAEKPRGGTTTRPGSGGVPQAAHSRTYPGDFKGVPAIAYAPKPDGLPDPGEIVWTWVPFEEDHTVGKDRPVLIVGSDGDWLLGVMLTSKDHDRDSPGQRRAGRTWVDIGAGAWDRSGRPSEVRVDRLIRIDAEAIRREGAVLGAAHFAEVADAIRGQH